ncbi:O-linked N-acetylglucosamine transferase, SPINDLY family protein [Radicibacter daui]|uniref:O-linked N-acetylglucosamine transferase, SPINDLY family protein n=1 Tax=Radicibacter daui TaxID=3064829 RepID=UPI004046FCC8
MKAEEEVALRAAVAAAPAEAMPRAALGVWLCQAGRVAEGEAVLAEASQRDPAEPQIAVNRLLALRQLGRREEAEAVMVRALAASPRHPDLLLGAGNLLAELGRPLEALGHFDRLLEISPDNPGGLLNRANCLRLGGRGEAALAAYRRLMEVGFKLPAAYLGEIACLAELKDGPGLLAAFSASPVRLPKGLLDTVAHVLLASDQIAAFEAALRDYAGLMEDAQAWFLLGFSALRRSDYAAAGPFLQEALKLDRLHVAAATELATLSLNQNKVSAAAAILEPLLPLAADNPGLARAACSVALRARRWQQASEIAVAALEKAPDAWALWSTYLMGLLYRDDLSAAEIVDEHRRFGSAIEAAITPLPASVRRRDLSPARRLRVGYVSGDFRHHSVAYFLAAVLEAHDPAAVEVVCYSSSLKSDDMTDRFRQMAGLWRQVADLSDDALAAQVVEDQIDILVDLSGHSADNRLPVFARRPAPVQLSWLGYPQTTGLAAMGYRLVDPVTDPPEPAFVRGPEGLVRLENGFHAFELLSVAPAVGPRDPGPVRFGSFNALSKISPTTLDLWASVLLALPDSRLVLKAAGLDDAGLAAALSDNLAGRGVAPGRIDFLPWAGGQAEHLALYAGIDIALDTFPYSGTTTTCEAAAMGVPTVTLKGSSHPARVSASLLFRMGLQELVAETPQDFTTIAVALAGDKNRLGELRQSLRQRLEASPVGDPVRMARALEAAYRALWQRSLGRSA